MTDQTQTPPNPNPNHESFLPQSTVLIVDDNPQNVELLQAFLEPEHLAVPGSERIHILRLDEHTTDSQDGCHAEQPTVQPRGRRSRLLVSCDPPASAHIGHGQAPGAGRSGAGCAVALMA